MMDVRGLGVLLESLCPMFLLLDNDGRIVQVGPTLQKLRPERAMAGQNFLDLFQLVRPRTVSTVPVLMSMAGAKLHLRFHDEPRTALTHKTGHILYDSYFGYTQEKLSNNEKIFYS